LKTTGKATVDGFYRYSFPGTTTTPAIRDADAGDCATFPRTSGRILRNTQVVQRTRDHYPLGEEHQVSRPELCIVAGNTCSPRRAGVFLGLYTRTAAPSAHGPANRLGKVIRLEPLL
jgi:hypothetical protein